MFSPDEVVVFLLHDHFNRNLHNQQGQMAHKNGYNLLRKPTITKQKYGD
jgi:hypothetical protein